MMSKLKIAFALSAALAGAATVAAAQPSPEARAAFQAKRAEKKAEMLAKFDTNRDGKLDESERAVMKDAFQEKRFEMLDTNNDGVISKAEFKQGKMFERHGRHGHRHGRGRGFGPGGPQGPQGPQDNGPDGE